MNNKELLNIDQMRARALFLDELVAEKKNQINLMLESLKRFEGYSNGSKELSDKIGNFIKKQQAELSALASQQKLQPDIVKFIDTVLGGTRDYVRSTCSEVEKLYFAKQGEFIYIQQEVENLSRLKEQLQQKIISEEALETTTKAVIEKDLQEKNDKPKRTRPDKDSSTRVGRAALDIAERKKKYKKKND